MRPVREIPARIRGLDPRIGDAALATAALLAMLPAAFAHTAGWGSSRVLTLVAITCLSVAAYLRRRPRAIPVLSVAAIWGLGIFQTLGARLSGIDVAFTVTILMMYSLGAHQRGRVLPVAGVICGGGYVFSNLTTSDFAPTDVIWLVVLVAGPILLGRAVRDHRTVAASVTERAAQVRREHEQESARAIEGERARIAGELHDVVAHSVTEMTVQAAAARRVIARDADAAADALLAAEQTGRVALTEMRHLLGVLRRAEGDAELTPQPSLNRIEALVPALGAQGLAVTIDVTGTVPALTPGLDLAAYRILEDSLRAALRQGARHAGVAILYSGEAIELRIRDDGASGDRRDGIASAEQAVIGVRERVGLYGGRLQTGRRPDGSFGTRVVLPTRVAVAA